jgi:SAM-dependent methyltransferase
VFTIGHPAVPGRIHISDDMLGGTDRACLEHYGSVGRDAVRNVEESLVSVGRDFGDVERCLEFPSGYGRVTRHLARLVDASKITVGDVNSHAVAFCVRQFRVRGILSSEDLSRLALPGAYDLMFVGSLFTHLPPAGCRALLGVLEAALCPGGVLVFTTQGESCLEHLDSYGNEFAGTEARYRDALRNEGIGFVPYRGRDAYGITLHAKRYIEGEIERRFAGRLVLVRFRERGWDGHQDVWSYRRA